jgi:hypothetical protein
LGQYHFLLLPIQSNGLQPRWSGFPAAIQTWSDLILSENYTKPTMAGTTCIKVVKLFESRIRLCVVKACIFYVFTRSSACKFTLRQIVNVKPILFILSAFMASYCDRNKRFTKLGVQIYIETDSQCEAYSLYYFSIHGILLRSKQKIGPFPCHSFCILCVCICISVHAHACWYTCNMHMCASTHATRTCVHACTHDMHMCTEG